jgi:hypothetical protein
LTEWLQQSDKRKWKRHEDIRKSLKNGQIITSIIQAINRLRCRKVIDAEGNCPDTDVYLMLPDDGITREILEGIRKEIPFGEFLDIEFDPKHKQFLFTAHYKHEPMFPELFKNLAGSPALKVIEDEILDKQDFRIHKQDWKPK